MCCSDSTSQRPVSFPGGAVAVIHPKTDITTAPTSNVGFAGRIYFHTPSNERQRSTATIICTRSKSMDSSSPGQVKEISALKHLDIVIHNGGDLTRPSPLPTPSIPTFFHFSIPTPSSQSATVYDETTRTSTTTMVAPLERRLDLSVALSGSDGIIGRRVSVVDGEGRVVGDGVVGWN